MIRSLKRRLSHCGNKSALRANYEDDWIVLDPFCMHLELLYFDCLQVHHGQLNDSNVNACKRDQTLSTVSTLTEYRYLGNEKCHFKKEGDN